MSVLLEVQDLSVRYGLVRAVDRVGFELGGGECLAILGRNGAGKSSLVGAVAGLTPRGGSVHVGGRTVRSGDARAAVRAGLAAAMERRELFPNMTVEDNLLLGAWSGRTRRLGPLRGSTQLARVYRHFPRLEERRSQRAGTLSGGEQQMVSLGRAMMTGARILLLDEPSLGLAPIITDAIYSEVARLRDDGLSLVVVEENPVRALGVADRVLVMDRGEIVARGPAAQFRDDPKLIETVYLHHERSADAEASGEDLPGVASDR